jgi:hypothetical protein
MARYSVSLPQCRRYRFDHASIFPALYQWNFFQHLPVEASLYQWNSSSPTSFFQLQFQHVIPTYWPCEAIAITDGAAPLNKIVWLRKRMQQAGKASPPGRTGVLRILAGRGGERPAKRLS